ncbi:MAG: pyrroline-5-carboxylate reductase family protein, partial [Acidimicrobiales bacterium]
MAARRSLTVVGGGKMGEALVTGLIRSGRDPEEVRVVEADPARRDHLCSHHPRLQVDANLAGAGGPLEAVVAVKPPDVEVVCRELGSAGAVRVLSIAAGVTLASIESW